jgi:hypothetical protein
MQEHAGGAMIFHIMPLGIPPASRMAEIGTTKVDYEYLSRTLDDHDNPKARGYIFFQPGDIHNADILKACFSSLLIRVGDLHHLENPILKTIRFIDSVYSITEKIYLNTNPSYHPLLSSIFPKCEIMQISELTIKPDR